jgi:hypothetical protein
MAVRPVDTVHPMAVNAIDAVSIHPVPIYSIHHRLIIIMQSQTRRNRTLLRVRIEIMPHRNARQLVLSLDEAPLLARRAPHVLQLEHFAQRGGEGGPDEPRAEAKVETVKA